MLLFTSEGSVWGVCANALVAPVVAPLTVFGLLAALCAPAFPALASLCVYPAQACTWWIDYIAHTFAGFYGSGIPVWLAGLVSLCLVGAAICVRRPAIACVLVAPVVLVIGVQWVMQPHSTIPEDLIVTAKTTDGEVMAVKHRDYPIYGVQFHPESIMTPDGKQMLKNFVF